MKKCWAVYTVMCTHLTNSSPIEYEYQIMQVALHQSDGGRPGADQPQRLAPTRVWSEPHRGPNKLAKEGGKRCDLRRIAIFFKKRGEETEASFVISHRISFGLEDIARIKIQIEVVEIGSIHVELNHLIKICK